MFLSFMQRDVGTFAGDAPLHVKTCLPVSTYLFLNEESLRVCGVPPCTFSDFIIPHLIGSLDINSSIYSSDLLHLQGQRCGNC